MKHPTDAVPVLYIGGEGRSGSTILATLLGNCDDLFPVGEIRAIWHALATDELCGCGEQFASCSFWQDVGKQAFGGWDQIDVEELQAADWNLARQRRVPRLLWHSSRFARSQALCDYRQLLARLYAAVAAVSGSSVIVDSTKDPAYALLLRDVPGVDLRLVHLVRDSRGVAYSWSKTRVERPEYSEHPVLRGTFMTRRSPWRGALEWDVKNLLFHCLRLSSRRRIVKYESLLSEPAYELSRILELVADCREPASRTFAPSGEFESRPFHTLGGNRVRFQRGTVTLKADDEWKQAMRTSDRILVSALTLPLLLRYRYIGLHAQARQFLRAEVK